MILMILWLIQSTQIRSNIWILCRKEERALYDDGVMRMGRTLKLCDAAITTTERLAEELGHYVPEVFINRNTASEEMCALSKEALKK